MCFIQLQGWEGKLYITNKRMQLKVSLRKARVAHIGQQIHLTRSLEESHFQRSSKSFLPVYLMDTGQQTEQDVSQHVRTGESKKPSFENQSQLHNLSNQY